MNIIAYIILIVLILDLSLNFWADYLNLKNVKIDLPAEFKDIYDPNRYQKSQEYLKVNTYFGWITDFFDLIVILIFWFGYGFPLLDKWVRGFGFSPIINGLIYFAVLIVAKYIIQLPFSLYATFVIEEKFGFNKTTWKTYITDIFKATILSIVLGGPLIAGILAFFEYSGGMAWLYCWIVVTVFMIVLQFIAPAWLLPLFNKYKPIEEGGLKTAIMDYARSIDFPLTNVMVMDGSKRSSKSNAFFTGFGKNKRIVLFDTLIEKHTIAELVSILAHEMGHFKKKHVLINMVLGITQMGVILFLLNQFISNQIIFDAFFMEEKSVYAGFIFLGILFSPIEFFLSVLLQYYSRYNEYAADQFAVKTTSDATSMIDALKKLSIHNLSNLFPHPFFVVLNYSHPPVLKRIERIKQITS